jgi:hypothetical protein
VQFQVRFAIALGESDSIANGRYGISARLLGGEDSAQRGILPLKSHIVRNCRIVFVANGNRLQHALDLRAIPPVAIDQDGVRVAKRADIEKRISFNQDCICRAPHGQNAHISKARDVSRRVRGRRLQHLIRAKPGLDHAVEFLMQRNAGQDHGI